MPRHSKLQSQWEPRLTAPLLVYSLILFFVVACTSHPKESGAATGPQAQLPLPIDVQHVQDQQDMTWDDYHPIPGKNWADPTLVPSRKTFKIALVAVDFPDQPFVITLPKKSDLFGNPQTDPIPREKVPQFYADFYNTPSALNHGHTINGYWMEQSRGQVGIGKIDVFGPYRMPKNLFQYGLNEWGQQSAVPDGFKADGSIERDADALWRAAAGDLKPKYDIILRIYAGYDETSVWQEFGEMKFQTKDDIPQAWGNPDTSKPRWVVTRYEPWTSWKAGQMQWGQSTVRQGESSGTITHEIVHFAFHVGDNNNNPYVQPYRRAGSGPWDIMDRGSFNGPGGPHRRWVVPAAEGAAMPAGLMLRSRVKFGFVRPETVLQLKRSELAKSGIAVANIAARAVEPDQGSKSGIIVQLDGLAPQDKTPPDDPQTDPLSSGKPVFDYYSVEVVQRIGYDSFTPDNGVLIAKNKNKESNTCGYNCFTWVIDAHPEDIKMLDFKRPSGDAVMRSIADYRQLNDALFHAGLNSGSQYEWEDPANRLHFYVLDVRKDARGILAYQVGVRSLDGSAQQSRGVSISPGVQSSDGAYQKCRFTVANTATPKQPSPDTFDYDIFRLSATVKDPGSSVQLQNALVAVKAGATAPIDVYVAARSGAAPSTVVTLQAQSESHSSKTAVAECSVTTGTK
jgi:M6 family metalloprotease-like protein